MDKVAKKHLPPTSAKPAGDIYEQELAKLKSRKEKRKQ